MSYGHVRDANVMRTTALIAFKYNLKTSQIIKICTGTFDTFDTFLQKVKNARDFGDDCLHFDTSNRTQSYQKDRKCQKCQKCHVIFLYRNEVTPSQPFSVLISTKISPIVSYFLVIS